MRFYKNLYLSPNIEHPSRVKWRLRHHAGNLALYVIVPSGGTGKKKEGENQLEILHCALLHEKFYRKQNLLIVGIAEGRQESLELVARIASDCYAANGNCDLKAYLFRGEAGT